ncbi:MAG: hypothetical protein IKY62_00870 [Clostridia bacterium]|nr:hypothetical protein [Clostridia bacterium]
MINCEYFEIDKRKIEINDKELSARLGRVCSHKDEELFRVCETLMQCAEPRCAVRRSAVSRSEGGEVELEFARISSTALSKNLGRASEAFVVAVTLGAEVDRMISKLSAISPAEAFIFDAVASAVAEAATDTLEREICKGYITSQRFSPGYGDFSISHQGALLEFLGAPIYLGVTLGESGLMSPTKTVTAVIGIKGKADSE